MEKQTKLILESLQLLLVQERERHEHELKLHRHPLTRQNHVRVMNEVDIKLAEIDAILNPLEVEDEGESEDTSNDPEPGEEDSVAGE